jgi:hypothetical protein
MSFVFEMVSDIRLQVGIVPEKVLGVRSHVDPVLEIVWGIHLCILLCLRWFRVSVHTWAQCLKWLG